MDTATALNMEIRDGSIFEIVMPFRIVDDYWVPGMRIESDGYGDSWWEADNEGTTRIEVVKRVCLSGKYQDRIFYKRTHTDPDGVVFKSRSLEVATIAKFQKLVSGEKYTYEIFELKSLPKRRDDEVQAQDLDEDLPF